MDNPFEYREVPKTVQEELKLRSENQQRNLAPAGRNGFGFRITSMCDKCDGEYQFDSEKTRQITNDNGEFIYPKINSISIRKQGELGTTKKCTVVLTCYSISQLTELQKCYFISGMSVRVELWTLGDRPPKIDRDKSSNEAILIMSKWTRETSANYEGLQGVVTNFSYNLTKQGLNLVWECMIEIVSASASALNHPTSKPCKNRTGLGGPIGTVGQQCETAVPGPDGEKRLEIRSSLYNHFKLLNSVSYSFLDNPEYLEKIKNSIEPEAWKKYFNKIKGGIDYTYPQIFETPYCLLKYRGKSRNITTLRAIRNWFGTETDAKISMAHEYYITWGRLELLINELVYNGASKKYENLNGHTMINSENVMLPWMDHYISTDPRVCVLTEGKWQDTFFVYKAVDGSDAGKVLWKLAQAYTLGGGTGNEVGLYKLHHILLNVVMLQNVLNEVEGEGGDGLISTFIQKVLDQVSAATGGVWELIVTANPLPDIGLEPDSKAEQIYKNMFAHLTVMEQKGNGTKVVEPYSVPTTGVTRAMDFQMKMSDAMKTQAVYGGRTSLTSNTCAAAAHTAFNLKNNFVNLAGTSGSDALDECLPCQNTFEGEKTALSYPEWMFRYKESEDLYNKQSITDKVMFWNSVDLKIIEDVTVESLAKTYRAALDTAIDDGNTRVCKGQPLPFELRIALNGIGGFGFGQLITSNYIPEAIRDVYVYQITAVEHNCDKQGWTTDIHTIPRTKFDPNTSSSFTSASFEEFTEGEKVEGHIYRIQKDPKKAIIIKALVDKKVEIETRTTLTQKVLKTIPQLQQAHAAAMGWTKSPMGMDPNWYSNGQNVTAQMPLETELRSLYDDK